MNDVMFDEILAYDTMFALPEYTFVKRSGGKHKFSLQLIN